MTNIDVMWFNCVGIARVVDKNTGETKYYIKDVKGLNEQEDTYSIINWGSKFPKSAGDVLFG